MYLSNKYHSLINGLFFAFIIFISLLFFHYQAFHSLLFSTLWKSPTLFLSFYLPKLSISLFFGFVSLIFKNNKWTIFFIVFLELWIIAELIYFRANDVFLDKYSITMIGNMNGFWGSVPMYLQITDLMLVAFIICYWLVVHYFSSRLTLVSEKSILLIAFALLFLTSHIVSTYCMAQIANVTTISYKHFNPFSKRTHDELAFQGYINNFSVIHELIYLTGDCLGIYHKESIKFTTREIEILTERNNTTHIAKPQCKPNSKLVIVLVESLESWVITPQYMPNLYSFAHSQKNILYAPKIKSQVKMGTSSDGQLIVETGILPSSAGAVCFRFFENKYPSLNELYYSELSTTVIPHSLSVWNQGKMSACYQYDDNHTCKSSDRDVFHLSSSLLNKYKSILAITMSTHSPFTAVSDSSNIQLDPHIPQTMRNYIKSMNYTDACMKNFLDSIINRKERGDKITLVITGDHTVFYGSQRTDFDKYRKQLGITMPIADDFTSLIIFSPFINESTLYNEPAFQMDIYPTVLHILQCDSSYYWKGLGENLLNPCHTRRISEEEAYQISDKILNNDYFKNFTPELSIKKNKK